MPVIRWSAQLFVCAIAMGVSIVSSGARAESPSFVFGGSRNDIARAVAVDGDGNVYIAGRTDSPDLPVTARAFQKQMRGAGDAFVAKFNAQGSLQWATYLGGGDAFAGRFGGVPDEAKAIAVDPQGNVYVAGSTASSDFPTANAVQSTRSATGISTDGFLTKIDPTGSRLIYSTYLGGPDSFSSVESVAAGPAGEAWVTINSAAAQFPVTRDISTGGGAAIVGKFQPSGSIVWMTRIGEKPPFSANPPHMAIDSFGQPNVLVASGLIQLDASGSRENYRWRGNGTTPTDIAAGPNGSIVISGIAGLGLEVQHAWQVEFDPAGNGFIAVLNARGVPDLISYVSGEVGALPSHRFVASDGAGGIHAAMNFVRATKAADGVTVPEHPDGPIFMTIDRGDSWTFASRGLYGSVKSIAIDAMRDIVYASGDAGIFRSLDRGASWSWWRALDAPFAGSGVASTIALDPRDPTILYGGFNNLYRLDQDGRSQTLIREAGAGVAGFRVGSLAVSPHDGSIWVGSGNGLEVSVDRGRTWTHRDRGFPALNVGTTDTPGLIVFDPQRPGRVFVRLSTGVSRSDDNGLTWQNITSPIAPFQLGPNLGDDFAVDAFDSDHLYLGSFSSGLYTTPDGGRRWTPTFSFPTQVGAFGVSPVPPYQVYARYRPASGDDTIIFSGDRGASWFAARHAAQRTIPRMIVAHPLDRDRAFSVSTINPAPFVMRMNRAGASYASSLSRVFAIDGTIGALTASVDGRTIVAMNGPDFLVPDVTIFTLNP